MQRGTQIIYVPIHAKGDLNHPDCEPGFITSKAGSSYYCRFWKKGSTELRTKIYSERCDISSLVEKDTVPQIRVEQALERYCKS